MRRHPTGRLPTRLTGLPAARHVPTSLTGRSAMWRLPTELTGLPTVRRLPARLTGLPPVWRLPTRLAGLATVRRLPAGLTVLATVRHLPAGLTDLPAMRLLHTGLASLTSARHLSAGLTGLPTVRRLAARLQPVRRLSAQVIRSPAKRLPTVRYLPTVRRLPTQLRPVRSLPARVICLPAVLRLPVRWLAAGLVGVSVERGLHAVGRLTCGTERPTVPRLSTCLADMLLATRLCAVRYGSGGLPGVRLGTLRRLSTGVRVTGRLPRLRGARRLASRAVPARRLTTLQHPARVRWLGPRDRRRTRAGATWSSRATAVRHGRRWWESSR
ncbi:hypothetical protein [Amycolatopsis sp. Hca4]|uniref:hypothetical protein n=1 Tax=Amycolatopsis sp. Hca4 TaxID=2742131 RepID=UPI0015927D10|nr:hypothetical protein [Amycolatopsis sp. Hca4]QKV77127.1 hypothetical protein HUT10_27630 [Amycolatopsis sp. Hca4]